MASSVPPSTVSPAEEASLLFLESVKQFNAIAIQWMREATASGGDGSTTRLGETTSASSSQQETALENSRQLLLSTLEGLRLGLAVKKSERGVGGGVYSNTNAAENGPMSGVVGYLDATRNLLSSPSLTSALSLSSSSSLLAPLPSSASFADTRALVDAFTLMFLSPSSLSTENFIKAVLNTTNDDLNSSMALTLNNLACVYRRIGGGGGGGDGNDEKRTAQRIRQNNEEALRCLEEASAIESSLYTHHHNANSRPASGAANTSGSNTNGSASSTSSPPSSSSFSPSCTTLLNLCTVLIALGRADEAVPLATRCVQLATSDGYNRNSMNNGASSGQQQQLPAIALHNLATAQQHSSSNADRKASLSTMHAALYEAQKTLGDGHPLTETIRSKVRRQSVPMAKSNGSAAPPAKSPSPPAVDAPLRPPSSSAARSASTTGGGRRPSRAPSTTTTAGITSSFSSLPFSSCAGRGLEGGDAAFTATALPTSTAIGAANSNTSKASANAALKAHARASEVSEEVLSLAMAGAQQLATSRQHANTEGSQYRHHQQNEKNGAESANRSGGAPLRDGTPQQATMAGRPDFNFCETVDKFVVGEEMNMIMAYDNATKAIMKQKGNGEGLSAPSVPAPLPAASANTIIRQQPPSYDGSRPTAADGIANDAEGGRGGGNGEGMADAPTNRIDRRNGSDRPASSSPRSTLGQQQQGKKNSGSGGFTKYCRMTEDGTIVTPSSFSSASGAAAKMPSLSSTSALYSPQQRPSSASAASQKKKGGSAHLLYSAHKQFFFSASNAAPPSAAAGGSGGGRGVRKSSSPNTVSKLMLEEERRSTNAVAQIRRKSAHSSSSPLSSASLSESPTRRRSKASSSSSANQQQQQQQQDDVASPSFMRFLPQSQFTEVPLPISYAEVKCEIATERKRLEDLRRVKSRTNAIINRVLGGGGGGGNNNNGNGNANGGVVSIYDSPMGSPRGGRLPSATPLTALPSDGIRTIVAPKASAAPTTSDNFLLPSQTVSMALLSSPSPALNSKGRALSPSEAYAKRMSNSAAAGISAISAPANPRGGSAEAEDHLNRASVTSDSNNLLAINNATTSAATTTSKSIAEKRLRKRQEEEAEERRLRARRKKIDEQLSWEAERRHKLAKLKEARRQRAAALIQQFWRQWWRRVGVHTRAREDRRRTTVGGLGLGIGGNLPRIFPALIRCARHWLAVTEGRRFVVRLKADAHTFANRVRNNNNTNSNNLKSPFVSVRRSTASFENGTPTSAPPSLTTSFANRKSSSASAQQAASALLAADFNLIVSKVVKIQCAFRSFQARRTARDLRATREHFNSTRILLERQTIAARRIQGCFRQYAAKQWVKRNKGAYLTTFVRRIQCAGRGYAGRVGLRRGQLAEDARVTNAATSIQRLWRGYNGRVRASMLRIRQQFTESKDKAAGRESRIVRSRAAIERQLYEQQMKQAKEAMKDDTEPPIALGSAMLAYAREVDPPTVSTEAFLEAKRIRLAEEAERAAAEEASERRAAEEEAERIRQSQNVDPQAAYRQSIEGRLSAVEAQLQKEAEAAKRAYDKLNAQRMEAELQERFYAPTATDAIKLRAIEANQRMLEQRTFIEDRAVIVIQRRARRWLKKLRNDADARYRLPYLKAEAQKRLHAAKVERVAAHLQLESNRKTIADLSAPIREVRTALAAEAASLSAQVRHRLDGRGANLPPTITMAAPSTPLPPPAAARDVTEEDDVTTTSANPLTDNNSSSNNIPVRSIAARTRDAQVVALLESQIDQRRANEESALRTLGRGKFLTAREKLKLIEEEAKETAEHRFLKGKVTEAEVESAKLQYFLRQNPNAVGSRLVKRGGGDGGGASLTFSTPPSTPTMISVRERNNETDRLDGPSVISPTD